MFPRPFCARHFAPLFLCQFLSAFNDNLVRSLLAMLLLFRLGGRDSGTLITLAIAISYRPFGYAQRATGITTMITVAIRGADLRRPRQIPRG